MIYLLYIKKNYTSLVYPYFWILDYLTLQRYIKFNNYYILFNIYNIFIKNNKFLFNYNYKKRIIKFEYLIQFLKNFYYIKRTLKLHGIGYKVSASENKQLLVLNIGYSYKIYIQFPNSVIYTFNKENNCIELSAYNKVLLTTIISKLVKLHKIDPYKGKGIMLLGTFFRPKLYKK